MARVGVGKTTVVAGVARTLSRSGHRVLTVDADPNPNLALSMGMDQPDVDRLEGIAKVVLRERAAHRRVYEESKAHDHEDGDGGEPSTDVEDVVGKFTVTGSDGVDVVETGRIERTSVGCLCRGRTM